MPPETQLVNEYAHLFGGQLNTDDMVGVFENKRVAELGLHSAELLAQFSETDRSFR